MWIRLSFLAIAIALVGSALWSCSSDTRVGLASGCTINSDCEAPLICAFGRCHGQCTQSRDCTAGERCVVSPVGGICQLPSESTCGQGELCPSGEICGEDRQCRVQCASAADCSQGDYCLHEATIDACFSPQSTADQPALVAAGVLSSDGAAPGDASASLVGSGGAKGGGGTGGSNGSSGGAAGSSGSGGSSGNATGGGGGSDSGTVVNECPNAQTQFGFIAQGDANPHFTSSVAIRRADDMILVSGYENTAAAGVDGGTGNALYVQSFDPETGNATASSRTLLAAPAGASLFVYGGAVSPTGQIAIVYGFGCPPGSGPCTTLAFSNYGNNNYYGVGIHAAFFDATPGKGIEGLTLTRQVLLESGAYIAQPHVIWSAANGVFVFSWVISPSDRFVTVQKYFGNGAIAGGNSDVVPTDDPAGRVIGNDVGQAGVGVAAGVYGVAYENLSYGRASLTLLDSNGSEIGKTLVLFAHVNPAFVTVAGTAQGFVYLEETGSGVGSVFVPIANGRPAVPADGDAATLPRYAFTSNLRPSDATALSDDGGAGGVGVALLYADGVSFAYMNADGSIRLQPSRLISHAQVAGDEYSVSTFGGSFALSLYDSVAHSAQIGASGCR